MIDALSRRLRPSDEAGMTLIELMVAMAILVVVGGMITSTVIVTLRTSSSVEATASSTATARTAQDRVLSLVRSAIQPTSSSPSPTVAFTRARTRRIDFYSQHGQAPGNPPIYVELWVNSNMQLIERITTPSGSGPDWTYSTGDRTRRVLVSGMASRDIFAFYDDLTVGAAPMGFGGWMSATDLPAVEAVEVTLQVNGSDPRTPPVTISSKVELQNLTSGFASS